MALEARKSCAARVQLPGASGQTASGRKRPFNMPKPVPKQQVKVPRASDLDLGPAAASTAPAGHALQPMPLPKQLVSRVGSPNLLIGFDVETHDWPEIQKEKGRIGKFGWCTLKEEHVMEFSRIVQIGWAIGRADMNAPVRVKTAFVQPVGFEMSEKATKFHGISHTTATQEGRPLADVLCDFMADVLEAFSCGGRVVAHQLEFDAGIVLQELGRSGLDHLRDAWIRIAHAGFCTMDFEVGRWVLTCSGSEVGPPTAKHCLGLKNIVRRLLPERCAMLNKHHDAGVDAQLTRMVYVKILECASHWQEESSSGNRTSACGECAVRVGGGFPARIEGEPQDTAGGNRR